MSRHLDEDDEDILPARRTSEREMTLGTGAILGIFFGLVLLLGAFFGFGYKLGSSAANSTARSAGLPGSAAGGLSATAATASPTGGAKPTAGSLAVSPSGGSAPGIIVRGGGAPVFTAPAGGSAPSHASQQQTSPAAADQPAADSPVASSRNVSTPLPSTPEYGPSSSLGSGPFVVQVAAISHQEDADLLVSALHSRGYAVAAHTEPGDKLVHIQVGPFGNKHDAEAMKQRLAADGYNAFIK